MISGSKSAKGFMNPYGSFDSVPGAGSWFNARKAKTKLAVTRERNYLIRITRCYHTAYEIASSKTPGKGKATSFRQAIHHP